MSTEPTQLPSREEQLHNAVTATFATTTQAIEDLYTTINAMVEQTNQIIQERDELKAKLARTNGLIQQRMDERDTVQRDLLVVREELI